MGLKEFFLFAFPVSILELAAFLAGLYYIKKVKSKLRPVKIFVAYLALVFLIELLANYSVIGYFSNYKYFGFIENSKFEENKWLYSIYDIINPIVICIFLLYYMNNGYFKKLFKVALILFFIVALYFNIVLETFFTESSIIVIAGTLLILTCVFGFFYELLKSELVLMLKQYLPMYIAVGVFVFNLVTTPLAIFSDYFNASSGNALFVKLQVYVVLFSNIFMYSCFITGFLVCSRKKKYS